jgi:hypothetical protein
MDALFGVVPHDAHTLETGQLGPMRRQSEKGLGESQTEFFC